ncbi:uncharacterized protein LOC5572131 [Aedes aegypti]|uniref:Gustatory receptor n=2 Tax=Aedes aegypti TaxID=7159 RepID=A0A1S4FMM0_AEDAE
MKFSICSKCSSFAFIKWLWLLAVVLALCLSSYAFYFWYCNEPVAGKYLKQWISIIIVWFLNLLVTAVIYWRQFMCNERIQQLNRNFIRFAEEHMCSTAIKCQQLWYQTVLLAYLMVSNAGLWLNMNPTYRLYSNGDLFLSVVLMGPIIVCSLTAFRYCVIFLTVSCILDDINRDLSRQVDQFHRQYSSANISAYRLTNSELKLSDHLDRLIIQYDKLYDVVVAIIEIYSPSILFLLVLDFGQVTFELYMFYCDLSHASLDDDDLHMIAFSFVSAIFSFTEILFIINGTSKFSDKLMQALEQLQRIGIVCLDSRLTECIYGLSKVVQCMQEETVMFYCFALNNSFLTTIIAASCSYLILLIQTA